ncbi:MAG TPA: carbohydrate ABC transporter permease [Bacilli bacterium]
MNLSRNLPQKLFDIGNHLFLMFLVLICIYPFYYIFIYSISIPTEAAKGGIYLVPKGFSLSNYLQLFKLNGIVHAFFISASRAVLGTAVTLFCTSMFAYALTKSTLKYRKLMYRVTLSTMYINAGLIPWYITMKTLGLKDNFLLYILPSAIIAFFLILIKTYIEQLPSSLEESAMMDGGGVFQIYIQIILPLCVPVLGVVAIFSTVNQWNTWQDNFFLAGSPNLQTLQLLLLSYLTDQTSNLMAIGTNISKVTVVEVTPSSIRMTITMIVTLPILFVYPLFQRFFTSGMLLGAVKG